jgi:suppressor of fused-like protein
MLMSQRELKVSDYLPFPQVLTHVVPGIDAPDTAMNAIMLVSDPLVPFIDTPRGRIEVRRLVGIHPDELERMETWSVAGLAATLARWSPELTTDVLRGSRARDPAFAKAMDEGSRRDGSQFGFVAVPGVHWTDDGTVITVRLPGGEQARRIHRMIEARLRHDKHLLVHDTDPQNQLAIALKPSAEPFLSVDGPVVMLGTTADSPMLAMLANPPDSNIIWKLR